MAVEYTVESFLSLRAAYEMLGRNPKGGADRTRSLDNLEHQVFACARHLSEKRADVDTMVWLCRQAMLGHARTELNFAQIVEYLNYAVEQEHLEGIRLLAKYYFGWDRVISARQIDLPKAMDLFERAAATGDLDSRYDLALALLENEGGEDTVKRARSILQALMTESFPAAFFTYYTRFYLTSGASDEEARYGYEILKQGLEALPGAPSEEEADWIGERLYYYIGLCYAEGCGCDKDIEKAIRCMKASAELNPGGDAYSWLYNKGLERLIEPRPAMSAVIEPAEDAPPAPVIFTAGAAGEYENTRIDLEKPLTFIQFNNAKDAKEAAETTPDLTKEDLDEILKPFDALVGLENVREQVRSLFYIVLADSRRRKVGLAGAHRPALHMVFSGNPGTGKTTVARLIGEILKKLGYLKRGHVVEVDRSGLVGEYVGQSEQITAKIIARARGGVLFVDEAYDLDVPDSSRDYGSHVISMIAKAMEDKREDMVVIFAGFRDEMKWFIQSNPGLRSRIGASVDFPDYKDEELAQIFERLGAAHGFALSDAAQEKIRFILKDMEPNRKDKFGNARGVRNLFDETLRNQARRIVEANVNDAAGLALIVPGDIPGTDAPSKKGGGKITRLSARR